MRLLSILLALAVILAVVFLRAPEPPPAPASRLATRPTTMTVREKSLLLTVDAPLFATPGQPHLIKCTAKNVGNGVQRYLDTGARREFSVNVVDARGVAAARTREGLALADDANTKRTRTRMLQPGQEVSQQYDLNSIFVLARKTRYTIVVSKRFNEFIQDPEAIHQIKLGDIWFDVE